MTAPTVPVAADGAAPPLVRRLACFLYEGILLFGVVMIAGLLWSVTTDQRHALAGQTGLQLFVFLVLGAYFVTLWTAKGQTLAMQTWHIRLTARDGQPLTRLRACARYVASWVWFAPALGWLAWQGPQSVAATTGVLIAGVLVYAASSRLHPRHQYWHDALCGTQLVHWRPQPASAPRA